MSATPTAEPVLEIRGLSVSYGMGDDEVKALDDVTITLRRGEVLGLAGESGSGKSTLVYGATRLLSPPGIVTQGEVLYHPADGSGPVDILRVDERALRKLRWSEIAMVFQGSMNSLSPVFRIERQLVDVIAKHDPRSTRRERTARARELLAMVGIPRDRLTAYPHQLSGGMRQRIMIAMAMALQPDVVIMDEPTTALDVVMQRQILQEILRLRSEVNFSVIFITHDVSLLIELADRIAIMYAGRIVEQGTSHEVYRNPQHPYTHGLLNSFPALRGERREIVGIPGSPPDLQRMPSGCPFNPRCPWAFDECSRTMPPLEPSEKAPQPGHLVACHLHESGRVLPAELAVVGREDAR
ncbi:ABC transporter ATP-binding protein [Microbacterium sp. NPDC089695]|uniref:ABC transporter ATP-binding protein n=1 Tax=Microbacterium sp. NPDC089695 TaxID=3364198 RepID=UPI0037FDD792